jgi:predicted transposase/invertase (TIGR01784 family)
MLDAGWIVAINHYFLQGPAPRGARPKDSKTIHRIEDLTEVRSMLETNTKNWERSVFEKGIVQGIEKGIEKTCLEITAKMIQNGMSDTDIKKIMGLPISRIALLHRKTKRK